MDTQRRVEDILRAYRPPLSNEQIEEITTEISKLLDAKIEEAKEGE